MLIVGLDDGLVSRLLVVHMWRFVLGFTGTATCICNPRATKTRKEAESKYQWKSVGHQLLHILQKCKRMQLKLDRQY